ncbi:MAG TPA: (4Fe-4S)-binding protein [Desulfotomaculum sp.]|nr:MAG: (4Fe-4S)-binding protein [Peptococcaceae bacterium BRH_c8a]KJS71807.1 MAG: (4Fe-4S)-binding protein [Desulfotomaculum sp. BICA1-6]HBX23016.1 (4Fe-4S)-binding protein [Desulfotomaculum sp.]
MIIAVASGKGGTGKTTVATGLVLVLRDSGHKVAYLDCDVEEPNGHIFMAPQCNESEDIFIEVPEIEQDKCALCGKCAELCVFNALLVTSDEVITFPELCHGCGGCRYFCPAQAVRSGRKKIGTVERGTAGRAVFVRGELQVGTALSPPLVNAVKKNQLSRGINVMDAPPGTSCPAVATVRGADFCILVTEPTPFGLHDLALAAQMAKSLGVPCGVVVNRAGDGRELIENFCLQEGLPLLMKIPLSRTIAEAGSRGVPLNQAEVGWDRMLLLLYSDIKGLIMSERAYGNQR